MYLADAFIQSDLQCIQVIHFCQYVCSLGIEPTTFCAANAMLYHWATEHKLDHQHLQVGDSVLVLLPVPGASLQVGVGDMEKYNITICFRNITILSWFFVMLVLLFC